MTVSTCGNGLSLRTGGLRGSDAGAGGGARSGGREGEVQGGGGRRLGTSSAYPEDMPLHNPCLRKSETALELSAPEKSR